VQNLPKENRRTLLLNGEPVAEPDYPALHCRLIYDLAGKPRPDKPFEIDGFERSEVKRAFYTMVTKLGERTTGDLATLQKMERVDAGNRPQTFSRQGCAVFRYRGAAHVYRREDHVPQPR
jgi:hypothetical protein